MLRRASKGTCFWAVGNLHLILILEGLLYQKKYVNILRQAKSSCLLVLKNASSALISKLGKKSRKNVLVNLLPIEVHGIFAVSFSQLPNLSDSMIRAGLLSLVAFWNMRRLKNQL